MTILVPSDKSNDDDLEALRSRVAEREAMLAERVAEVARAKSDLERFRINYRQRVGILHEQLDRLEAAIAEAEAEVSQSSRPVENGAAGRNESPAGARPTPLPRFTSDAVRKLFRDVAKAIHPDLANDEFTRDRRHHLMVEANLAYASRDQEQLRVILHAWERSLEAVPGSDPEAAHPPDRADRGTVGDAGERAGRHEGYAVVEVEGDDRGGRREGQGSRA